MFFCYIPLDGIKALIATLTDLTPSATDVHSVPRTKLPFYVCFITTLNVLFFHTILHKYVLLNPSQIYLVRLFHSPVVLLQHTHTGTDTPKHNLVSSLLFVSLSLPQMPFSVDFLLLWHLECSCITALEWLLPSDSVFEC